jgi:hypothetical protein
LCARLGGIGVGALGPGKLGVHLLAKVCVVIAVRPELRKLGVFLLAELCVVVVAARPVLKVPYMPINTVGD